MSGESTNVTIGVDPQLMTVTDDELAMIIQMDEPPYKRFRQPPTVSVNPWESSPQQPIRLEPTQYRFLGNIASSDLDEMSQRVAVTVLGLTGNPAALPEIQRVVDHESSPQATLYAAAGAIREWMIARRCLDNQAGSLADKSAKLATFEAPIKAMLEKLVNSDDKDVSRKAREAVFGEFKLP